MWDTRVFHPRDDWTRCRHALYSSPGLIGLGMSIVFISGLISYDILEAERRIILSAQRVHFRKRESWVSDTLEHQDFVWLVGSGRYVVGGNRSRDCILWMWWTTRSNMVDYHR